MAKYHYKRYLYGTNSKRNSCTKFQNGQCSIDIDACPGIENCNIYKSNNSKDDITRNRKSHAVVVPLTNTQKYLLSVPKQKSVSIHNSGIIEMRLKREIISGIISKYNVNHYYGIDDFYGEVYIRKDQNISCIMEIGAKKIKIEEILNQRTIDIQKITD